MRVTDLNYPMENALIKKLDLMIERCDQKHPIKDACLVIEGGEGDGKTNMSCCCAYYISQETGRPFSISNIFFSAEKLMKFVQTTSKQIIIYDEPSLDMLSNEWWKKEQRDLIKTLMMARKKQHFIIFNITKFNKFPEYVIVDRALGMIHVYARKEMYMGHFVYIKKRNLEKLYNDFRFRKVRNYKKYTAFRGKFPDRMGVIIDVDEYEKQKDAAIMSIGKSQEKAKEKKKDTLNQKKLLGLKKLLGSIKKFPIVSAIDLAGRLDITTRTLQYWSRESRKTTTKGLEQEKEI